MTFCLSASSFWKASKEFSPSGQVPLAPGERLYLLSKRAPSLRPLRYLAQSVKAPLHSPMIVGWVELATLASMFRSTWSRCFCQQSQRGGIDSGEKSGYIKIEDQKIEVEDLVVMVIDDVGTGASLLVLIVPLEGIDECITDGDSRVWTAGTSNDLRAARVIIDNNSRRLLLVAKLFGEWFIDKVDGRDRRVVAVLGGDYLNDLVRVVNIAVFGPGGIQCVLARIVEPVL